MHVDWAASQRLCLQNPGNCEQSCPRQGRFNNLLFTTAHSIKQTNTVNQVFIWTKRGKEKTGMYMTGQARQVCLSGNAGRDSLPQLRAERLPWRAPGPPRGPRRGAGRWPKACCRRHATQAQASHLLVHLRTQKSCLNFQPLFLQPPLHPVHSQPISPEAAFTWSWHSQTWKCNNHSKYFSSMWKAIQALG